MPELPELEAFKNYIEDTCLKKEISAIELNKNSLVSESVFKQLRTIKGDAFASVQRLGKYLIIDFTSTEEKLVMHFGLTGFLVYCPESATDAKVKFSQVAFIFNDRSSLHYCSRRKFGNIWFVKDIQQIKQLDELGPDVLKVTQKDFLQLCKEHQSKNIKSFLMDQSIMAGIGNEYSDEVLFQAGIDPHHTVADLAPATEIKLYHAIEAVLRYAIKVRTEQMKKSNVEHPFDVQNMDLFKSSYLQAHRHTDHLCPHDKNHTLKRAEIGGRTTYYCPEDQK